MSLRTTEELTKTITEQQKIIDFYRQNYRSHTGNELTMPQTWSRFLDLAPSEAPLVDKMQDDPRSTQKHGEISNIFGRESDAAPENRYFVPIPKSKTQNSDSNNPKSRMKVSCKRFTE
jgi:hypothetical protein